MAHESMSTSEAATALGVSLRTVQLWVESGALRAWKTPGGHRRVLRSSVDSVLAERQAEIECGFGKPLTTAHVSEPFRLLVVEDEENLLKLYRLRVRTWDFPVDLLTAQNGFEALIRIGEQKPDFMIADLNMPGMDGFRLLRFLAARNRQDGMQIVVVTALRQEDIIDRGGLPKDILVLPKPIPFSDLEKMVRAKYDAVMSSRHPHPRATANSG